MLGGGGGSKTLSWGFAMAPHRLHILVDIINSGVRSATMHIDSQIP